MFSKKGVFTLITSKSLSVNKANLRDLIAVTHSHLLLIYNPFLFRAANRIQSIDFSAHVTLKSDRWPWKPSMNSHRLETHLSQIVDFSVCVRLKFDGGLRKTTRHLFHAPSSYMCHFIAICELKLNLSSRIAQIGAKSSIFLTIWCWNLTWPW